MGLPSAVQRRVDAEAAAWARSFPDPLVPDPALRAAVHRFADGTAPRLLPAPVTRPQPTAVLGTTALALAGLALVALVLPRAAVPLLVVGALVLLGVAWTAATPRDSTSLDELRAALRAAAYGTVLGRRADAYATGAGRRLQVPRQAVPGAAAAPPVRQDPVAVQGRATYAAAAALDRADTARVIDL